MTVDEMRDKLGELDLEMTDEEVREFHERVTRLCLAIINDVRSRRTGKDQGGNHGNRKNQTIHRGNCSRGI